jgi:hypothetical protein
MPDAGPLTRAFDERLIRTAAPSDAGELWQDSDGLAAFQDAGTVKGSGLDVLFKKSGEVPLTKATGVTFVAGDEVWWDHSANNATYKPVNDRDFYVGTSVGDWVSADSRMVVNLNGRQRVTVDLLRDGYISVATGTQALGSTGFSLPKDFGGSKELQLTATSEAQCVDMLSVNGFAVNSNWIISGVFRVISDGAGTVVDFSIGAANATSTTDAGAIPESAFIHLNANDTAIYCESDDNAAAEVAETDSTDDYVEGATFASRHYFTIDGRDPTSVKFYTNGVARLTGTTFNVNAALGPFYLLALLEKTSSTDTYKIVIDKCTVRTGEQ